MREKGILMDRIETTPAAVSKLKKSAKLRVRNNPNLNHAQALDDVAKEAGYHHWKHVTDSLSPAVTESPLARLTSRALVTEHNQFRRQELLVIVGPTGSGKTLRAYDYALNALREGLAVQVLDIGRSYKKLVETVGGTWVSVEADGSLAKKVFGQCNLLVVDIENTVRGNPLPSEQEVTAPFLESAPGLLIVDEIYHIDRCFAESDGVRRLTEAYIECGGSVILLAQQISDLERSIPIVTPKGVRRAMVRLSSI